MAEEGGVVDMDLDEPRVSNASSILGNALDLLEQRLQRDHSRKDTEPTPPLFVNFDLAQNDLSKLKELWIKIGPSGQKKFKDTYGDIALLLDVKVEEDLLKAALYFWNPSYRCFVFGKHDMVPTVEEYRDFLMMKKAKPSKIFLPLKDMKDNPRFLAKMVEMGIEEIRQYKDGDYFQTDFLMKFVDAKCGSHKGIDVLAFLIYGLVVFPRKLGYIHLSVVTLLTKIKHQTDPSAAILAETVRSLNTCRKAGGRFEACAQMLVIWFKSHFGYKKKLGMSFINEDRVPIVNFGKNRWPPERDEDEWYEWFRSLGEDQITWTA